MLSYDRCGCKGGCTQGWLGADTGPAGGSCAANAGPASPAAARCDVRSPAPGLRACQCQHQLDGRVSRRMLESLLLLGDLPACWSGAPAESHTALLTQQQARAEAQAVMAEYRVAGRAAHPQVALACVQLCRCSRRAAASCLPSARAQAHCSLAAQLFPRQCPGGLVSGPGQSVELARGVKHQPAACCHAGRLLEGAVSLLHAPA